MVCPQHPQHFIKFTWTAGLHLHVVIGSLEGGVWASCGSLVWGSKNLCMCGWIMHLDHWPSLCRFYSPSNSCIMIFTECEAEKIGAWQRGRRPRLPRIVVCNARHNLMSLDTCYPVCGVSLFLNIVKPWGSEASLQEIGHWGQALRFCSWAQLPTHFRLPVLSRYKVLIV